MNIVLIERAIELLDEARFMTPSPKERKELDEATQRLRQFLARKGVFIGEHERKS